MARRMMPNGRYGTDAVRRERVAGPMTIAPASMAARARIATSG
jgi:hypothetical protein